MNLKKSQDRINELMSRFVAQVKGATAMSKTDINIVSENVLIPLFSEIYGHSDLRNLNVSESPNFPGIDLADDKTRIAYQITSTSGSKKIKDTLKTFVDRKLYEKYDHLIIYILTEKQRTYQGREFGRIIQDKFSFDKKNDIRDYRDLLKKISEFPLEKLRRVENILEQHFGEESKPIFNQAILSQPQSETLYLNLLEIFFPEKLYISDLAIARNVIIENSSELKKNSSTRDILREALRQKGLNFSLDWVSHKNKLITFHDLNDDKLPLTSLINPSTTRIIATEEFYDKDIDHERVFVSLLGRCMQQKLYHKQIQWQHEDKLFIFFEVDGHPIRREQWQGKKTNSREVYKRTMKRDSPHEILSCKHLSFLIQYKRFGGRWFILIKPEWFISRDTYRKSYYMADRVDYLKKRERNEHVFNHLKAIVHIIKHDRPPNLFRPNYTYPFLSFGDLLNFDMELSIDDNEWLTGETKQDRGRMKDSQDPLPLSLEI